MPVIIPLPVDQLRFILLYGSHRRVDAFCPFHFDEA